MNEIFGMLAFVLIQGAVLAVPVLLIVWLYRFMGSHRRNQERVVHFLAGIEEQLRIANAASAAERRQPPAGGNGD